MLQPKLKTGRTVSLDKLLDRRYSESIAYIGDFVEQLDSTWIGLANIKGLLCLVEVKLSSQEGGRPQLSRLLDAPTWMAILASET